MQTLKRSVKQLLGQSLVNNFRLWRQKQTHKELVGKSSKEIFTSFYEKDHWGDRESKSGPGSSEFETRQIRRILPELIQELNINVLLDVPCGDFNWMKSIDLGNCNYIGGDIVKELIKNNQNQFESSKRVFFECDITKDELPNADLILCRDCLFHLSFEDIFAAIGNFKTSKSKYLLTTTHPDTVENFPILTGGYRGLNMCLEPFNFPTPLKLIYERRDAGFADIDKCLGLWKLSDL
ncbi:class I SAM-dependent methyltransferase [aff. Roholtiella sp. LEGE 12411]|uniref:class I SAM-dependent methyltransferase n=1 Tax=aff. Roholtiella sp. LEGE 12411 TaxID=1828822 RepID=UPI0018806771|nr:class I SAM-dependent methyltransferase [aff. Roholtiella sp. LEGE 12411]MBE9035691.1 class I SAM-dependent methyltransferase [aff. Roholtiella sp. LEGE 12411]